MVTWGSMTLNDQDGHELTAAIKLNEENVISDPAASTPQTVLMGGGRLRRTFSASGYITASDYSSLEADFFAMTKRSLKTNEVTMDAYIQSLSMSREIGSAAARSGYISYNATWVEG